MKVFFVLDPRSDPHFDYPYILISAAPLWYGKKFRRIKLKSKYEELFLDSGGFSFFYRSGDYPFSIEDYVELARYLNADYVAIMDYPCEPDVVRIEGLASNIERIEAIITNAHKLMKYEDVNWVMVLQGYLIEEYMYAVERIKEEGLTTDLIAIGSLCLRKKRSKIYEVIKVARYLNTKLHGFGIDIRALRYLPIFASLYSVDTGAWRFSSIRSKGKQMYPLTREEKLLNLKRYREIVDNLLSEYEYKKKKFGTYLVGRVYGSKRYETL